MTERPGPGTGVTDDEGRLLTGLSEDEAARRLASHGPNAVPHPEPPSVVGRVLAQLRDPMILLLCGALVVVLAIGDSSDAVIIGAVVVLNTTIGVVQEVRAEHAIAALDRLAAPRENVLRDGRVRQVEASDVVHGDVVRTTVLLVFPVILGEVYDNAKPEKKFGQTMTAQVAADVAGNGKSQILVGLRQDANYRS